MLLDIYVAIHILSIVPFLISLYHPLRLNLIALSWIRGSIREEGMSAIMMHHLNPLWIWRTSRRIRHEQPDAKRHHLYSYYFLALFAILQAINYAIGIRINLP